MKNKTVFTVLSALSALTLVSCGAPSASSTSPDPEASTQTATMEQSTESGTSAAPKKSVEITSISLMDTNNKAFIRVTGTVENFEEGEFTWAWGLMNRATNEFEAGSETPDAEDFRVVSFKANNKFTVDY